MASAKKPPLQLNNRDEKGGTDMTQGIGSSHQTISSNISRILEDSNPSAMEGSSVF